MSARGGVFFGADSGVQTIAGSGTYVLGLKNPADSTKSLHVRVVDISCSDAATVSIVVCEGYASVEGSSITPVSLRRPKPLDSEALTNKGTKDDNLVPTNPVTLRTALVPKSGPTFIPIYEELILQPGHGVLVKIVPSADSDEAQAYIEWRED